MKPSIAFEVVDLKTSQDVWHVLEDLYGVASKAHIIKLRKVLQNIKKGLTKMSDYLTFMKQTFKSLKLIGELVTLNYLMSCVRQPWKHNTHSLSN